MTEPSSSSSSSSPSSSSSSSSSPSLPQRLLSGLRAVATLDLRSLGLFRIAVGLLVVTDALTRLRDVEIFLSKDGVGRFAVGFVDSLGIRPSLHHLSGETWWQSTLLLAMVASGLLLSAGWRTRPVSVVVYLLVLSVQNRNNYVNTGADSVLLTCCLFAIFLPVSARFSLDARAGRAVGVPAVADGAHAFASLAGFCLVLQTLVIYVFNVINKTGSTWRNGTAVLQALHIDQHTTVIGQVIRDHLAFLSPALTYGTLIIEFSAIFLLLPVATGAVRGTLVVAFWALHAGLGLSLYLGLFSPNCMVLWLAFVPAALWQRRPLSSLAARLTPAAATPTAPVTPTPGRQLRALGRGVVGAAAVAVVVCQLTLNVQRTRDGSPPAWMARTARMFGVDQLWRLFAQNPSRHDGWMIVAGEQKSGAVLDLYDIDHPHAVTDEKPALVASLNATSRWRKFMLNIANENDKTTRRRYAAWICRRWNQTHDGDEALVAVRFRYWLETTRRSYRAPRKKDRVLQDMNAFACTSDGATELRAPKKEKATAKEEKAKEKAKAQAKAQEKAEATTDAEGGEGADR